MHKTPLDMKQGEFGVMDYHGDFVLIMKMYISPGGDGDEPALVCVSANGPNQSRVGDWWSVTSMEEGLNRKKIYPPEFMKP